MKVCGPQVCAKLINWSDSSFFSVSHLLLHYHFMDVPGGREWTNSVGEVGSRARLGCHVYPALPIPHPRFPLFRPRTQPLKIRAP